MVSEAKRRKVDVAAMSSPRFRELISHLIVDNPHHRRDAQQAIDFLR